MDLLDANILIGAFRPDDPHHATLHGWLQRTLGDGLEIVVPALVEVAFLRITTHPGIFSTPSPLVEAASFLRALDETGLVRAAIWTPQIRFAWWARCQELGLAGNDVNDAYLATLAIEGRFRLVSRDRGFARFRGLDWWDPAGAR